MVNEERGPLVLQVPHRLQQGTESPQQLLPMA